MEQCTEKELTLLKNKVLLWCSLQGWPIDRGRDSEVHRFWYKKECKTCYEKNGGKCIPGQRKWGIFMDMKKTAIFIGKISPQLVDRYLHNNHIWCVEWIRYV